MVGEERDQVCMLDLVVGVSVVEGKKSAQFCIRGIGHVRRGISVVMVDIISGKAGVLGLGQVGVGGSN